MASKTAAGSAEHAAAIAELEKGSGLDAQSEARRAFNAVRLTDDEQQSIESFDDALALFNAKGWAIEEARDVVGDGIPQVDKATLVNMPLFLTSWRISKEENESYGRPYLVVEGITKTNEKFRFVDGSTGIARELMGISERRIKAGHPTPNAGLLCSGGLNASTYETQDQQGKDITATTYHLGTK